MKPRVGVFNVGFHRYWPQFSGLKEKLDELRVVFENRVAALGAVVVSAGLVDTVEAGRNAGDFFAAQDVDLILCDVTTYVVSAFVVPVAQRSRLPMILVGLQPTPGMDTSKASMFDQLLHDNCTAMPEIAYALRRSGIKTRAIFGLLDGDDRAWRQIEDWVLAAKVLRSLRNARIGLLGHPFEGMLDMNADPTAFTSVFGMHVEMVEMCDFKKSVDAVSAADAQHMKAKIRDFFCFPEPASDPIAGPVSDKSLDWSARVAVGLERLAKELGLDGIAHYYRGVNGNEEERLISGIIVGGSLLTGRGIPVAGEGDLKNCVAMLMMDRLGAGGSFCELHPANLAEDFVFIGHDGPGHIGISSEKPALRGLSLYHGKFGSGVSVEFKVKHGPVTIAGLTLGDKSVFKLVVAEGESCEGSIPCTGNTNTRARFRPDTATFIERWTEAGPTHHFALGVGRQINRLRNVAELTGMEVEVVATLPGTGEPTHD